MPSIRKHLLAKEVVRFNQEGRNILKEYIMNRLFIKVDLPDNFVVVFADNLNRSRDDWQFSF